MLQRRQIFFIRLPLQLRQTIFDSFAFTKNVFALASIGFKGMDVGIQGKIVKGWKVNGSTPKPKLKVGSDKVLKLDPFWAPVILEGREEGKELKGRSQSRNPY